MALDPRMRYFYRISTQGKPVPGSLIARRNPPKKGRWKEVPNSLCCVPTTTTTTTTTTSSTTTTTTT